MPHKLSIRHILFAGILLLFAVQLMQDKFNLIKLKPLGGDVHIPEKVSIGTHGWFSGEYQEKQEIYLNETFGFRNMAIRLYNQIAFSLFNTAKANSVIIGKENYLFEDKYIDAYYGSDYIGEDSIRSRMEKMAFINDTLTKQGKTLLLVFAAGKGSYFPEYFPESHRQEKKQTNHPVYLSEALKHHIPTIDFHTYFIEHKNKSAHPLYPKYGIHWSMYGMALVADSIIRFLEHERNIDMPNIFWTQITYNYPKDFDYDIAEGMNLLFALPSEKMAYPNIQSEPDSGKTKPALLTIADSFYWGLFHSPFSQTFSHHQFWFYNKQVYSEQIPANTFSEQLNLKEQIDKHDIIMIMCTESNLPNLGWGFVENMYQLYHPETEK